MSDPMNDDDFVYQYQRWSRNDLLAEVRRLEEEQAVMLDVIRDEFDLKPEQMRKEIAVLHTDPMSST